MTPIDIASLYRNLEVLNLLIEYGVKLRSRKHIFLKNERFQNGKPESTNITCNNKLCNRCHNAYSKPILFALRYNLSPVSRILIDCIFSEISYGEKFYHTSCSAEEYNLHHYKYITFGTKIRCIFDRMYWRCIMTKDLSTITLVIQRIVSKAKELDTSFGYMFRDCQRCKKSVLGKSSLQSKILAHMIEFTLESICKNGPDSFWYEIVRTILVELKKAKIYRINCVDVGQYILQANYSLYTYNVPYCIPEISEMLLVWNFDSTFSSSNARAKSSAAKIIYGGLLKAIKLAEFRFFECIVAIAKHIHVDLNTNGVCLENNDFGPILCTVLRQLENYHPSNDINKSHEHLRILSRMADLLLINNVNPYLIHDNTSLGHRISGINFQSRDALERFEFGRETIECIACIKHTMRTYHQRITLFDLLMNNVKNAEIVSGLKIAQTQFNFLS